MQGRRVLQDFNIEVEAGGVQREIIKKFTVVVNSNTLEIRFYWAGRGTTIIPEKGVYGPLISAISVENPGKLLTFFELPVPCGVHGRDLIVLLLDILHISCPKEVVLILVH